MKPNRSIKLKAALLLMVFALNTVVAFACSLGLNMGYNQGHHHEDQELASTASHSHSHTTQHQHKEATHSHEGTAKHSHESTPQHHHDAQTSHHNEEQTPDSNDCCTGNAVKFQAEDKKLQQVHNIQVKAPVLVAFLSAFYGLEIASPDAIAATYKFIIPQYYPPPDIRIVIQSFQI